MPGEKHTDLCVATKAGGTGRNGRMKLNVGEIISRLRKWISWCRNASQLYLRRKVKMADQVIVSVPRLAEEVTVHLYGCVTLG